MKNKKRWIWISIIVVIIAAIVLPMVFGSGDAKVVTLGKSEKRDLSEVVAAIVRNDELATESVVRARTPVSVAAADAEHFLDLVLAEFASLHQGNAVRFGLRPFEFSTWHGKHYPS